MRCGKCTEAHGTDLDYFFPNRSRVSSSAEASCGKRVLFLLHGQLTAALLLTSADSGPSERVSDLHGRLPSRPSGKYGQWRLS